MTAHRCLVVASVLILLPAAAGAQPTKPVPGTGLPDGAVARLGQTRLRHAERPTCVVFAPDGKTFITGGEDGTVRVWSVATGDMVRMLERPGRSVSALRYTNAGTKLAVHYTTENVVRLLDPATLRDESEVAFVNKHRFAFSADGKLIAAGDAAGNLTVAEAESELPKLELAHADVFEFRPDGKAIATGDAKGNVAVHMTTGGKRVFKLVNVGTVFGIAYSPDGKRLAIGARAPDGTDTVRVYADGAEKPIAEVLGMNLPLAWLTTDTLAVTGGTDAGVYDFAKGAFKRRISGTLGAVAVSPDGSKLAATGGGGLRVRLWDLPTGKQLHAENDSFPAPALMIGTRDGAALFLLANDTAYLWPLGSPGAKVVGSLPGHAVAAAANGGTLLVATAESVCAFTNFDPQKALPKSPARTFDKSGKARVVALAPNGQRLAWADESGTVVVADLDDRQRIKLPVVTTTVLALEFSPDGTKLAQFGRDGFLRLWSMRGKGEGPDELWKVRLGRGQRATIAFSPDGKLVAAASLAQVPVLNVTDGTEVFKADRYSDEGYAHHVAFSPDSRLLAFGSSGIAGHVEVWEITTRGLVRQFSTGYGGISRLCIFPDGNRVASAGAEEAVTVWALTAQTPKNAPTADELASAWAALESQDAAVGYPAAKVLARAGERGTETIAKGTDEVLATQKKAAEWIEDLGSKSFTVREVAAKRLLALGVRALPVLGTATKSDDTDVRDRARELILKIQEKAPAPPAHGLAGDALQMVRAVQVLEQIGTPSARKVLADVATLSGLPGEEARAALVRLGKKP